MQSNIQCQLRHTYHIFCNKILVYGAETGSPHAETGGLRRSKDSMSSLSRSAVSVEQNSVRWTQG